MTYEEFEYNLYNDIIPNRGDFIRIGQALMNYLGTVWLEEYKRITEQKIIGGLPTDCFYVNRFVPNTLLHLKKVWHNYPN